PCTKNQISSTVRWATAIEVSPGASSKWARPPPLSPRRMRTSEPSGAMASRCTGSRFVLQSLIAPSQCGLPSSQRSQGAMTETLYPSRGAQSTTQPCNEVRMCGERSKLSQKTNGYGWRTPSCQKLCLAYAFFEGKNAWETYALTVRSFLSG